MGQVSPILSDDAEAETGATDLRPDLMHEAVRADLRGVRRLSRLPRTAQVVFEASPSRQEFALTFDDGPVRIGTPAVLDVLRDAGVKSTFFVLTELARREPHLVERIVREGHELALHSDSHDRLDRLSARVLRSRLDTARTELENLASVQINHFRPPFGATSWRVLRAARQVGLRVVMWSHSPDDYLLWRPQDLDDRMRACLRPGALVLLHDGADTFEAQGKSTAESLGRMLPELQRSGLVSVLAREL